MRASCDIHSTLHSFVKIHRSLSCKNVNRCHVALIYVIWYEKLYVAHRSYFVRTNPCMLSFGWVSSLSSSTQIPKPLCGLCLWPYVPWSGMQMSWGHSTWWHRKDAGLQHAKTAICCYDPVRWMRIELACWGVQPCTCMQGFKSRLCECLSC